MGRYFGLLEDSTSFKLKVPPLSLPWLIGGALATGLLGGALYFNPFVFSHSSQPTPNTINELAPE
jgi:hypothetical protein